VPADLGFPLRSYGDRVLFHPDDQYEVEIQGVNYLVMRERDLHAIANERPEHGTGLYL
jgi:chaperonin GroES